MEKNIRARRDNEQSHRSSRERAGYAPRMAGKSRGGAEREFGSDSECVNDPKRDWKRPAERAGASGYSRRPRSERVCESDIQSNLMDNGALEGEVVYGRHPVLELLQTGKPVQRLHVLANATGIPKDIFSIARERAIPVVHTDRARLDHLSHHANHQGVVAEAGGAAFADVQELLERPHTLGQTPFFAVLDGVQDPGNFGAILRSAEAAGVHGVFVPGDNSCGLTGAVCKTSAGAVQHIPVARVAKLTSLIRLFQEAGYVIAGTEVIGSVPYTEVDFSQPTVIVMGAEESGLRPSVRELCTHLVRLPMLGKVQSLNVSAAASVFLYEVVRQRGGRHNNS